MEIKMVSCPNGHYYNAAIHKTCPDCARGAQSGVGSFSHTVDPKMTGGAGAAFNPTLDPYVRQTPATIGSTIPAGGEPTATSGGEEYGATVIGGDIAGEDASGASVDPVVGWLVCVEGPCRGTDFRVHAGYNYIGRESGDICLEGDNQISRQHHAMIAYDSADHSYYFGPSGGRNLVRVNGKTILNAVDIHNYDVLSIGNGKYLFVALCGSHFGWNEGLSNG